MSETSSGAVRPARRTRRTGRSPGYPTINLEAAIKRAQELYEREGRNPAPIGAITSHWGYKSHTSGIASTQYAALKKFGLLTEEGSGDSRTGRLTELAYEILKSPDPTEAILRAALAPQIHREMWDAYRLDLPSDASLEWQLKKDRGFTESGAKDFVKQYRETLAFATKEGALEPETESGGEFDQSPSYQQSPGDRTLPPSTGFRARTDAWQGGDAQVPPPVSSTQYPATQQLTPVQPARGTRIPIPLVGGQQIVIEGEFPITEAAWANFKAVLEAFKPGLVTLSPVPSPSTPPTPYSGSTMSESEPHTD